MNTLPVAACGSRQRRALVLSGGGSRAVWQVGACEHLIGECGYWFDVIAGVSAGALNGAILAQAHNPDELKAELERLRSIWFGVRGNDDVYGCGRLGPFGLLFGKRSGVYDISPLRHIVFDHLDPPRVAASSVALRVGYVDLLSRSYRTAGNEHPALVDAVLASCAVPVIFPPIPIRNGRELGVDGGVRNVIPLLDVLTALFERPAGDGPDEIWVLTPHRVCEMSESRFCGWPSIVRRCVSFLTNRAFVEDIAQARQIHDSFRMVANQEGRRDATFRVLCPQQPLSGSCLDFHPGQLRRWYADGVRTARHGEVTQV